MNKWYRKLLINHVLFSNDDEPAIKGKRTRNKEHMPYELTWNSCAHNTSHGGSAILCPRIGYHQAWCSSEHGNEKQSHYYSRPISGGMGTCLSKSYRPSYRLSRLTSTTVRPVSMHILIWLMIWHSWADWEWVRHMHIHVHWLMQDTAHRHTQTCVYVLSLGKLLPNSTSGSTCLDLFFLTQSQGDSRAPPTLTYPPLLAADRHTSCR